MARIPDEQLERLKQDISLERLVESAGITLKRHGQDLIGLCPFHDDREPSLVITPRNNLWHCLGACQTGGSVIDWVMQLEGVSFRHAVELLREGTPLTNNAKRALIKYNTVAKLPNHLDTLADDQALLNQVIDYYHDELNQHPDALAYADKRGITREAIDHFKLGVANRTLGYRLPQTNRKDGADIRGRLQHIGLIRDSGHEHFNGSLVIPVFDDNGNVCEVYGRKLINKLRKGTPKHLYLPGPHQGMFNLESLKINKEIILCESLIDALTFWCAGFKNVTCSYGIEGFTDEHLNTFNQYETQRVLIAYDSDAAGNTAAESLSKKLIKAGIDCYRLTFPKGMDANQYACEVTPASKSLGVVIRSAQWMGNGQPKPREAARNKTDNKNPSPPLVAEQPATKQTPEPLPATPVPDAPAQDNNAVDANADEIKLTYGDRHYRLRGLKRNTSVEQLKINILVSCGEGLHIDTFDLYAARPRAAYIKQAAIELSVTESVIKGDIGKILLQCEALQQDKLDKVLETTSPLAAMTEAEQTAALSLLKSDNLLETILSDFNRCGVVGEETNKLVGYLAAVSRKLDEPLAIIIQSTSAAGKTALMDAVLSMIPEEEKVQYSAMTGQSLFYMGETNLKHKILAISEEEGAHQAAYALKLLQSEGSVTIASTGRDPDSGKHITHEYKVEGPVMLFLTTTAIDIDEELMNRCLVLTVDEHRDQTKAIHQLQRKKRTLDGLKLKQQKQHLLALHHNAQRLLRSLAVVNPYAEQLTFLDAKTRTRRDHEKYLTLIDSIALLHQYQRPIKTITDNDNVIEYVEVALSDIAHANRLAHEVLGRSLDELPPQTRRLLAQINTMVKDRADTLALNKSDVRFSRRDVRTMTGGSDTAMKVHMSRLVDMEYLLIHKQGNRYLYELLYDGDGQEDKAFMMGLIDVEQLKHDYDTKRSGQISNRSESAQPPVRGQSGAGQVVETHTSSLHESANVQPDSDDDENAVLRPNNTKTHRSDNPSLVAKPR